MELPPATADSSRELSADEILDHISDGFICLDADLRYTHVNETAAQFLQSTREEMLGKRAEEVFPDLVGGPFFFAMEAIRDGRETEVEVEEYYAPLDRWYAARYFPSPAGGVIIFFEDTTRRRKNTRRLALALAAGKMGVWEHDFAADRTEFDEQHGHLFGIDPNAPMSEAARKRLVHPDDWDEMQRRFGEAVASGAEYEHEYRTVIDGEVRWMRTMASITRDSAGEPLGAIGVTYDVTEHKLAEQRLLELTEELELCMEDRAQQLQVIAENVPGFLSHVDRDLCYQYVNCTYEEAFELSADQIIGRPVREIMGDENWARVEPHLKKALAGEQQNFEIDLLTNTGTRKTLRVTNTPRREGRDDEVTGVFVFAIDVSAERRLQKEVLESGEREKKVFGQDLHDTVCQELAGIGLLCKALEDRLRAAIPAAADDAAELVKRINATNDQARKLAHGLSPLSIEDRTLREILVEFLEAQTVLHPGIRFTSYFQIQRHDLDPVIAMQLYYIAREAIFNAIKHAEATQVDLRLSDRGGQIRLAITDDGIGDPELLSNGESGGGLGLQFMRYRVRLLGGSLAIESGKNGKGVAVLCRAPIEPNEPAIS